MNEQIEPESSTENGLVSVIMIFLNAERFIEEAIESVLSQTYDRWELLLVDDGSTDRSTAIARRYAAELPDRIRYLDHTGHQNRGMSASRNMGIAHAGGEYIAFLDADDVYLPQKLEKQIEILEHYPEAGLVYGATQYWFSWTGSAADARKDRLRPLGVPPGSLVDPPHLFRLFLENKARTPCTCAVLIRRSAIKDAGGFEERFSGMYEDQVFFYKLSLIASAFVADGCWDRYRQHADSEVYASLADGRWHRSGRVPSPAREAFVSWLVSYVSDNQITDRRIWRELHRQSLPFRYPRIYQLIDRAERAISRLLPDVLEFRWKKT